MKLQHISVIAVLALLLGIAGLMYPKAQTFVDTDKVDVQQIVRTVYDAVMAQSPTVGAANSPAVIDGCVTIEGVTTCYRSMSLSPATNTPCRLAAPRGATSTLVNTTLRINVGSSTASAWHVSTTTGSFFATTTPNFLGGTVGFPIASGAQGSMVVGPTTTSAVLTSFTRPDGPNTIVPGGAVVWSAAGFLPADVTKFAGSCSAVFQII